MHITIDYTPAVHQGAGIGRHTRGLVNALAPLLDKHKVTLLVFGSPPEGLVKAPDGMDVRIVPIASRWLTIGWHRLKVPLPVDWLSSPSDLYHASDFALPPVRRAKTLLTIHDLSFLTVPEYADERLRCFLANTVPHSVRRANHILADSKSTKRDLVDLMNVDEEQITVVYPGVDHRFQPLTNSPGLQIVREKYGLGRAPFILGVSTLEPRKNWPGLIRSWDRLRRETDHPHRLVIAGGKGWLTNEIFRVADESDFREDITFTGFVEDADLPHLYSAADLFALPTWYEGFGIPVVEAMACGTPVVCSDNSSLPEAAGDAALLVDAADEVGLISAMRLLIENDSLRSELRQRGLAQARRFTWESAAQTLLSTYERVFSRP
ncbi:MAG: glycosyltransferase family 1 protein [Chloroflexota bacterium]|nr:glycosyltransferase family 1 protein [Chloroflexota bacterium]